MIKVILSFVFLTLVFGFGIQILRTMTGKDRWALTKTIGYATICSLLAFATMTVIVFLF